MTMYPSGIGTPRQIFDVFPGAGAVPLFAVLCLVLRFVVCPHTTVDTSERRRKTAAAHFMWQLLEIRTLKWWGIIVAQPVENRG
jgi:hypothetical protein